MWLLCYVDSILCSRIFKAVCFTNGVCWSPVISFEQLFRFICNRGVEQFFLLKPKVRFFKKTWYILLQYNGQNKYLDPFFLDGEGHCPCTQTNKHRNFLVTEQCKTIAWFDCDVRKVLFLKCLIFLSCISWKNIWGFTRWLFKATDITMIWHDCRKYGW